ncbi:MAG: hypothetical protein ACI9KN_002205 [Gammaproteobacteria bacterium]|jgi:hypothetical protein
MKIKSLQEQYLDKGFLSAIDIVSAETARQHRIALETAESQIGSLHYVSKVHTILQSPFELATNPA